MKSLVLTFALFLSSVLVTADESRPNIIYIMADDLGWAELGSYGQEKIKTPHLDKLAKEGMRFTQHYTSAPVCGPARYSLMTGKHGGHSYVRDNSEVGEWDSHQGQLPMPTDEVTIAELLKGEGYTTGAFGKWGIGQPSSEGDPLKQGFDRFYGYNCQRHAHNLFPSYIIDQDKRVPLAGNDAGLTGEQYAPQLIADQVLEFVEDNQEKPFFLYYPTIIPHLALQVPDEELKPYLWQWEETPYTGKSYLPHPTPRAAYAAMITFMDKQMGRLFAKLEELGLAENTVVFFTSDNGTTMLQAQVDYEFFDSVAGLKGLKGDVYEGGIRIPMIVRWPGKIEAGSTTDHLSAHYDALATITDITGIEAGDQHDGVSYKPTLLGEEQAQHDYLFWDFGGYGGQLAMREGDWKAVRRNLRKNPDVELELYHLANDPFEKKDVASVHPEKVAAFTKAMIEARDEPVTEKFRFGKYE